jgi:hypothetical protein
MSNQNQIDQTNQTNPLDSMPKSRLPVTVWTYKGFLETILTDFLNKFGNEQNLKNKIKEYVEQKCKDFDQIHSKCGKEDTDCVDFDTCCSKCKIEH